jgi:hypothetical protein
MVGLALILGRAVAGNWKSTAITTQDFIREGAPAFILMLLAIGVEWWLRPTSRKPHLSIFVTGFLPAVLYVILAAAWVVHLGWWEGYS